jgi:hypothetical protein
LWLAPGTVTLTFEAPGHGRSSKSVTAVVGAVAAVTAELVADVSSSPRSATYETRVAARGGGSEPAGGDGTGLNEPGADRASGSGPVLSGTERSEGGESPGDEGSGRALRWTGIAVAGVGLGLLGAGVALRHVGEEKLSALEGDALAGRPYNPDNGNWKTFDRAGVACLIGGGAAVITGVLLYVLSLDEPGAGTTATAARPHRRGGAARAAFGLVPVVSVGPVAAGGAALGLLGRF